MSAGQVLLDADGRFIVRDGGKLMLSDGEGDLCCCVPLCYEVSGFDGRYYFGALAADVVPEWPPASGFYSWSAWGNGETPAKKGKQKIQCFRLLVWDGIEIEDNEIPTDIGSPTHVLKTNGVQCRNPVSTPRLPFTSDWPGTSTPMSSPPYWYAGCQRGGFATTTIAHLPTGAQLNGFWGASPVPDGTYTLLVAVKAWRYYQNLVSSPSGCLDIPDAADSKFAVSRIWLQEETP